MFYTGFDATRRFPHLIVASASLRPLPPLPHSKREWPCLPTPTLRLAFQQWRAQLWLSPPSLARNVSQRPLLPTPALRLVFRATEGLFTPITTLPVAFCGPARPPSLKMRVGGLFFSHLPSVPLFERRRALFMPTKPSVARNASWRVHSANHHPPTRVSSEGGLVHAHHALPCSKHKSEGLFCPHLPSVSRFERRRALFMPSTPSLAQNTSREGLFCPTPALRLVFQATEGSVHAQHTLPCPKRESGGSVLPQDRKSVV